jgi:phosphopantetheinyl transferase
MIYLDYAVCGESVAAQRATAKAMLSALIEHAFGISKANELMQTAKGGKLYIENADFDFSNSHTGGAVAVAACGEGAILGNLIISDKSADKIGVDIESKSRDVKKESLVRIAKKLFSKKEFEYLNIEADGCKTRFLELWTKKEAIVKATGEGLAGISGADTFSFSGAFLETYCVTVGNVEYIISVAAI